MKVTLLLNITLSKLHIFFLTQSKDMDELETKVIILPSGLKAEILQGKGKHAQKALQLTGGDQSKYLGALMAQLVLIEGKPIVMEDLDEMSLRDYIAISEAFSEQNFI